MDYIISILPQMWLGTIETLKLFFFTIVLSIPLGNFAAQKQQQMQNESV